MTTLSIKSSKAALLEALRASEAELIKMRAAAKLSLTSYGLAEARIRKLQSSGARKQNLIDIQRDELKTLNSDYEFSDTQIRELQLKLRTLQQERDNLRALVEEQQEDAVTDNAKAAGELEAARMALYDALGELITPAGLR